MTTISTQLGGDEYCGSTIYPNELYDYVSLNNASEADTLDYAYKHECSVYRCFYAYNYHYFSLSGYGVANPNTDDYICE